jgi:hypothetical protein
LSLEAHSVIVTSFQPQSNTAGLALFSEDEVSAGDLLRFTYPDSNGAFWLFVDSVDDAAPSSPPSLFPGLPVTVSGRNSYQQGQLVPPSLFALPVCERITMDLRIQGVDGQIWNMTDLGLGPLHPRYWGFLPDDLTLYSDHAASSLDVEASHPRFPIAGPLHGGCYLPLGVQAPASPLAEPSLPVGFFGFAGPDHSARTELERNGLAQFRSSLFLDRSLADTGSLDVLTEAFYIEYQSPTPRDLTGIHAALAVDEVTIIAVPDAVQRGWVRVGEAQMASPIASSPLQHPERWHLECGATVPPGDPQTGEFEPCDPPQLAAPVLRLIDFGGGRYSLVWAALTSSLDYLEEAVDPNFATAAVTAVTASGIVDIYGQAPGDYYYRVRRQSGTVSSDYSNSVSIRISLATGWEQQPLAAYNDSVLVDVHRALVRMSAARGDLFAVLAVPAHYREREAAAHAAQIRSVLSSEPAALSFAGVYHPWLIGREEDDLRNLRTTPPDGATAGIFAKRSSARGAWISPANEPLTGVVTLSPAISRAYLQFLQDAQVNLIRQEPDGFLCLSEMTLTDDDDLLPINVRRLLSFLRKTALREGNQYVFEPSSDEFRRGVQRGFEELLHDLASLGAFAGARDQDSFQVVTDSSLNTPAAADLGRFYVDLQVAPSVPMRFLTIRLLQTADRTFVTEGQ